MPHSVARSVSLTVMILVQWII